MMPALLPLIANHNTARPALAKLIPVILAPLLLAACSGGGLFGGGEWVRSGTAQEQTDADLAECAFAARSAAREQTRKDAQILSDRSGSMSQHGLETPYDALRGDQLIVDGRRRADRLTADCMSARGYKRL